MKVLPCAIVVAVIISVIGFFSFDAGLGKSDGTRANLIGKHHTPAWVQFIPMSDGNGGTTIQIIHHPDVFTLFFDNLMEVNVSRVQYHSLREGVNVVLTYRVGKWTGIKYGSTVHSAAGPIEK